MAIADRTLVPENSEGDLSFPTESDLSGKQYYYVKLSSGLVVACGANEKMLGILQNAPDGSTARAAAIVRTFGNSKLIQTETIAQGNFLTSTAAGAAEICDAAGEEYGAVALTAANSGDLAAVTIMRGEVEATDA